jgi:hypothetical protein
MTTTGVKQSENESYSMEDTQEAHLAGFIDAVGTIRVAVEKSDEYSLGYRLNPRVRFYRPSEDDPILGKFAAYCEEYGVKYEVFDQPHTTHDTDTSVGFQISRPEDIRRFLEPLSEHLVTKFVAATLMVDTALPAIENGHHLDQDGFLELVGVADEMRQSAGSNRDVKYTQEYFEEEFSIPE